VSLGGQEGDSHHKKQCGARYETWVQRHVLHPLGIGPGEAFVTQPTRQPLSCEYAFTAPVDNISAKTDSKANPKHQENPTHCWTVTPDVLPSKVVERMDSHGGWHMTPRALVRLSSALQKGKILSKAVIKEMHKTGCAGERMREGC